MGQTWVRVLACSELVGGVMIIAGGWFPRHDASGHLSLLFPFVAIAASALSIAAGWLLWLEKGSGLALSLLAQGLQVVSINVNGGWRYVYFAGLKVTCVLASVGVQLSAGGGGGAALTSTSLDGTLLSPGISVAGQLGLMPSPLESAKWALGINILALYFFIRLWRLDDALTSEAERAKRVDLPGLERNGGTSADQHLI